MTNKVIEVKTATILDTPCDSRIPGPSSHFHAQFAIHLTLRVEHASFRETDVSGEPCI